jgi:hypothetical protein
MKKHAGHVIEFTKEHARVYSSGGITRSDYVIDRNTREWNRDMYCDQCYTFISSDETLMVRSGHILLPIIDK